MSATSSDTESSCDWTIINNEGSDLETLDSGSAVEHGVEVLVRPPVDPEPHYIPSSSGAGCDVKPLDNSQTIDETLSVSDAGDVTVGKDHVTLLSSSDHSDIVSLGDMKHDEEAAAGEVLYLGSSSSSQYTFTPAERVFPVQLLATTNSSSEDEAAGGAGTVIRRRRLRRNTTSIATESGEESGLSEEEEEEEEEQKLQDKLQRPAPPHGQSSSVLNKCILLSLVVAVGMGFDHFYGTVQFQGKQKTLEKVKMNELHDVKDLIQRRLKDQQVQVDDLEYLEKREIISLLTEVMEKITGENHMLHYKQADIQAQKDNLEILLQESAQERRNIESWGKRLTFENQLLKNSLNCEEKSVSILQEEIRSLHAKFKDLEEMGSVANSLQLENQRLKEKLRKKKRLILMFHSQRDGLEAEAQMLRKTVDKEMKVTETLRKELSKLRAGEGEQNSRLMELKRKLTFEQQRSDMWERLYLETQEVRAKGETESKVKNTKKGFSRKVKETFDAVKNSTKEFVHHHKEQIKKAKEAVKKNLRKFSDSVKSTIRQFKDSASTFINKARGFYRRPHEKDNQLWHERAQETHHRHAQKSDESFQSNRNTRKSGGRFQGERGQNTQRANMDKNKCAGVFDCAYQESMSLFHKATEPIRADEFHQLLQGYIQQEVDHFHHWEELEMFIGKFFRNGVFIHDQMLFTDFVRDVKDYLVHNQRYHGFDNSILDDLDDYVYRHFFGDAYSQSYRPSGPFERPQIDPKEELRMRQQQRKQRARPRPHSDCKWSRSDRNTGRHMVDAKIELGPLPFDPKY
ncbi:cell cycle progression protein 1 [Genypterus blacodes]|uniref:cell cycle progression protein 1 n=1 Tax=Genypterus blacodes TaxID=154954 RepID=UPI003F773107